MVAAPELVPFLCRGCGSPLLQVDLDVSVVRILRPVAGLIIAMHGGWAEAHCPLCNTHNRLEAQRGRGRPPSRTPQTDHDP